MHIFSTTGQRKVCRFAFYNTSNILVIDLDNIEKLKIVKFIERLFYRYSNEYISELNYQN